MLLMVLEDQMLLGTLSSQVHLAALLYYGLVSSARTADILSPVYSLAVLQRVQRDSLFGVLVFFFYLFGDGGKHLLLGLEQEGGCVFAGRHTRSH
mmetsp:Transcript_7321/g.6533  ORF Transcript_7321/g.6533 Transcript_7321/m.6533 type:complete len:95 (-) Transcript_7321:540-824(-)